MTEQPNINPTVIVRVPPEETGVVTIGVGSDAALLVFRGPEDARAFQEHTGEHDGRDGFEVRGMDLEDLAWLLDEHGLLFVAMPEPWTGEGGVDLFNADAFLLLLEHGEG